MYNGCPSTLSALADGWCVTSLFDQGGCQGRLLCADDAHSAARDERTKEGCHCEHWECSCHCGAFWAPVLCIRWHKGMSLGA